MGRPRKTKPPRYIIGKGEVTPKQIAYLVDCYLGDNGFTETRNHFRIEASSLLASVPPNEVPENMLPLDEVLDEYVLLKKHKAAVEKEKNRADNLIVAMKHVIDAYVVAPTPDQTAEVGHNGNYGNAQCSTQNDVPVSLLSDKRVNSWTPSSSLSTAKRKGPEVSVGAPRVSRKARTATAQEKTTANGYAQNSTQDCIRIPTSLLPDKRVDSSGVSTPSTSQSISGKGKSPEVSIGVSSVLRKPRIDTAQENLATNGYAQYSTENGMPVSLLHDNTVDLSTPSTSPSIFEVSAVAPSVSREVGIAIAQEKSAANAESELQGNSNLFTSDGNSVYAALLDELGLDNEEATGFDGNNEEATGFDADIFAKFIGDADEPEFWQMLQDESDPKDKTT